MCYLMSGFNYLKFNEMLAQLDDVSSVSEIHGLITGFVCVGNIIDGKSWLEPIVSHLGKKDAVCLSKYKSLLLEIHEITSLNLHKFGFDFFLLIPDDDTSLQERAKSLSYWCQGFIMALHRVGMDYKKMLPSEATEVIHNIAEISKLDYELIDITDKDELAYNEVMEYVRMGVVLIYSELAAGQNLEDLRTGRGQLH